jgi:hypothetical protein
VFILLVEEEFEANATIVVLASSAEPLGFVFTG